LTVFFTLNGKLLGQLKLWKIWWNFALI
jgi:hypothetical protein